MKHAPIQLDFNVRAIPMDIKYACIPWAEYERMYCFYAAEYGASQSAERIAERGGLGVREAIRLGYDKALVIWVSDKPVEKDSDWTKLALSFDMEEHTFRYAVLTEEEYRSTDLFKRIQNEYDKEK